MSAPLSITVPMPQLLTNSGGPSRHWRAVESAKKRYWKQLDERQNCGLIPAPPRAALGPVRLSVTMYLGNPMDNDNAVARCKWPLDWLRTRGYVRNDTKRLLTWAGFPDQVVRRGQDYRIEFTLTPLAEV